jgi:6-phosphogluconolactonase
MKPQETQPNISIFETPERVALAAGERFVECSRDAVENRGVFSVALAGGNTPRRVYELLASVPFKDRVDWPRVHLFFGDERAVPADHPDSNYRMAYEALISKVPIPAANVHRIVGEGNAKENARTYEEQLQEFFAGREQTREPSWPRFDLIFLGMGEDGHTASLFPGSEALNEKSHWVVATRSERLGQERITLTLPVLNHAARVVFLVTGKEKAQRLREVLRPKPVRGAQWEVGSEQDVVPAQMVQPVDGKLEWLVDRSAASLL